MTNESISMKLVLFDRTRVYLHIIRIFHLSYINRYGDSGFWNNLLPKMYGNLKFLVFDEYLQNQVRYRYEIYIVWKVYSLPSLNRYIPVSRAEGLSTIEHWICLLHKLAWHTPLTNFIQAQGFNRNFFCWADFVHYQNRKFL